MIKRVGDSIADVDAIKIASDMIRIPSYSFMDDQELLVAGYIYELFKSEGIDAEMAEVLPGRCNVTAKLKGRGDGKSLMFTGHLDTVPQYDMEDAFSGSVRDGRVYGRGACDMKGPLASMIAAMIGIHRSGISLGGDLIFAGLIDEEEKGKGVEHLVKCGPAADAAITGEPTNMQPAIGHKGLEWIKIKVFGKKVHGGRMDEGINAIVMASILIRSIYDEYVPGLKQRKHEILGSPTINIGKIQGGDQPSTVPGSCFLEIDRRWIPGESKEQVYKELNDIIEGIKKDNPAFQAEVYDMFGRDELLPHMPFCTDKDDSLLGSVEKAVKRAGGDYKGVTTFPAWSDAGIMASNTDMKCIVMGPGDLALAHSAEESIGVDEIKKAALIYGYLACDYCGAKNEK